MNGLRFLLAAARLAIIYAAATVWAGIRHASVSLRGDRLPAPDDWKDRVGFYGSFGCLMALLLVTHSWPVKALAIGAYFGIYQTLWRRIRISTGLTRDAVKIGRAFLAKSSGDPKPLDDLIADLQKVERVEVREAR